jgi:predicted dehydrogenase
MLESEQPGIVWVCLPNESQDETTVAIIRAGLPLFVEKPLVFDLPEADPLLAEATQRRLFFGLHSNHRFRAGHPGRHQALSAPNGTSRRSISP